VLKHNEVNPLAVFGLRRVDHCPPHFSPVRFDIKVQEKIITDWIWENLDGRFYFGEYYYEDPNGSFNSQKMAAFEEPGEASYFALILDTVNKTADFSF
jgi:hypothetical protein